MIWGLVRMVLLCHSGGAMRVILSPSWLVSTGSGGLGAVILRPAVVVGYPRIDLDLDLIGSGPGLVHHLVIWSARVL